MNRIGIDIGRVIIAGDGPDTSFVGGSDEEALRAPSIDGAFPSIARIVEAFGSENVFLVSKCGKRVEARSRLWLAHHRFYAETGVLEKNLRFCRTRPEKAPICDELGIQFFVDDREDVLSHMNGVVRHRFLFVTWPETERAIFATLAEGSRGSAAARAP